MRLISPIFRCGECLTDHESEEAAVECWLDCAQPEVDTYYRCPVCGDDLSSEEEALECCGYDPDAPPPMPTAAELEAAGQLRLVP